MGMILQPIRHGHLARNQSGSVIVEAAFAVPLLVALLLGMLAYGSWFMTAHSLQQAANDAARASVAGLTAAERRMLVDQSVSASRMGFPARSPDNIEVRLAESDGYCTVTLRYALSRAGVFAVIPLPAMGAVLERSAVARISG